MTRIASNSSCFSLQVKYAEVIPRLLVCTGDIETGEFMLADENTVSSKSI